jgi:hypothetical protein
MMLWPVNDSSALIELFIPMILSGCGWSLLLRKLKFPGTYAEVPVFTVTSASIVGNSKHTGIGLLGFDRVNQEALDRIGSIGSKAKVKREAYSLEINELLNSNQLLKAVDVERKLT